MRVLISKHASDALEKLPQTSQENVARILELMENEKFPRIKALVRSDYAAEGGALVRKEKDIRIVYRFDDSQKVPTIIIVTIYQK